MAVAVASPGAEAPAQPDPPHGICPRCPAASAWAAGKAAAAGSIKPKCFLFQTIKRLHDTRGAERREETLRSLHPAPLPTLAARRDGVRHRAGTRARGRTGTPQVPRARDAAGPGVRAALERRASAGAALPAPNPAGHGRGHRRQLGTGNALVPRRGCSEQLRWAHTGWAPTGSPTGSNPTSPVAAEQRGAVWAAQPLPRAAASRSRHERLCPPAIHILSMARRAKSPGASAGCWRALL